jgi:hypothetical protein
LLVDGFGIIPYNNIIIHKEVTKMTNAQLVLQKIQSTLCHEGTTYKGNSGTYMFIEGKTTEEGTINGVVKKLDEQGAAKTAGSFKIVEDGTVFRFTGLATKTLKAITKEVQSQTSIIDEGVQPEVEQQPESIAV